MNTKRILVVDDDKDTVEMMREMLVAGHYEVVVAYNGPQAIEETNKHHMDLILMDVRMPVFSGIWFSHAFKKKPNTKNIPIVIVSSHIDDEIYLKGRQIGVSDYLKKPFRTEDLLKIVEKNALR